MVQRLEGMCFTVVPLGQGYKDMSPASKELMKLTMEKKIAHGGNPVLRWIMSVGFLCYDATEANQSSKFVTVHYES